MLFILKGSGNILFDYKFPASFFFFFFFFFTLYRNCGGEREGGKESGREREKERKGREKKQTKLTVTLNSANDINTATD